MNIIYISPSSMDSEKVCRFESVSDRTPPGMGVKYRRISRYEMPRYMD